MNDIFPLAEAENLECRVRDGTILRADIYRPALAGSWPVLLCRTPYNKQLPVYRSIARTLAQAGYLVVVQDIRGRHASDGDYVWMFSHPAQAINEEDGFDAVQWASDLKGADGRVAMWGNSYASYAAWRAAGARPPALAALFTSGIGARYREQSAGLFEIGRRLHWAYCMAADLRRRAGSPFGPTSWQEANRSWNQVERGKWIWRLPLQNIPDDLFSTLTPQMRLLMHESRA